MKYVGAHVSIEGGIFNAPLRAEKIGAKAFACFTKNQKRWSSSSYTTDDISKFKDNLLQVGISSRYVLAHAGYLINLGNPDIKFREQSINALIEEVERCEQLGIEKIVFHPGSHLKLYSEEDALNNIALAINNVIAATNNVALLIENTAGQGGSLGYKFAHLGYLIAKTQNKNRIGVCIDTCHLFASGYDFITYGKHENVWHEFDQVVGIKYLKGMHLNDCKSDLGSKLDRHDSIGKGKIGIEPFKILMQDPRFDGIPLILETVNPLIWDEEIKLLYSFM